MKKTVGVLSGLVVAVAAVCTAGAWYTGKQLPEVLDKAVAQANIQLKQSVGTDTSVELTSLESHLYSSTAHYRVSFKNLVVGNELKNFDLNFVDRIEHGPLPWTRLKSLQLMPVMASSNYALEKEAATAQWFAVSGEVPPLHGQSHLGYDGAKPRMSSAKARNTKPSLNAWERIFWPTFKLESGLALVCLLRPRSAANYFKIIQKQTSKIVTQNIKSRKIR